MLETTRGCSDEILVQGVVQFETQEPASFGKFLVIYLGGTCEIGVPSVLGNLWTFYSLS